MEWSIEVAIWELLEREFVLLVIIYCCICPLSLAEEIDVGHSVNVFGKLYGFWI